MFVVRQVNYLHKYLKIERSCMKNKSLIALLVGFSIPTIIMPIASSLVELAEGYIEIAKGGQVKRITEINIENTKLSNELEELQSPIATSAIGYKVPSSEYIYGDECQCDDCKKETTIADRCPIGFN